MDDSDFFQAQLRKKVLKSSQRTKRDPVSRSTRLLEKRKEMLEVQVGLDLRKEEFSKHEDDTRKKEEDLRRKDLELQESLVKFNRFLLDNDAKRAEAERKTVEAKKVTEQKDAEIVKLRETLENLKHEEQEKKLLLQKYRIHEIYLASVIEKSEEFKEIKTIIDRWKVLVKTIEFNKDSTLKASVETEKEKALLQKYTEEKTNEILGYNNSIVAMKKELEKKIEKSIYSENDVEERVAQSLNKTLEATQIKMACDNIYRRTLDRSKQKPKKISTLKQIQFIGSMLEDYTKVVDSAPSQNFPLKRSESYYRKPLYKKE